MLIRRNRDSAILTRRDWSGVTAKAMHTKHNSHSAILTRRDWSSVTDSAILTTWPRAAVDVSQPDRSGWSQLSSGKLKLWHSRSACQQIMCFVLKHTFIRSLLTHYVMSSFLSTIHYFVSINSVNCLWSIDGKYKCLTIFSWPVIKAEPKLFFHRLLHQVLCFIVMVLIQSLAPLLLFLVKVFDWQVSPFNTVRGTIFTTM